MTAPRLTKDELRLLAKFAAREYVQETDKVKRLRVSISAKLALMLAPSAALPSSPPAQDET